ncbi:tRNA 2'-phosphotransferase 1 [Mortierella sp. GBA35]|nr:tRNA 2'-phosphotransferase 1 [Mortierella sp. AD031]KAF9102762.1 tRNA 2'-phosphotransferase 1 [Mortierella sp. GBA35]KAG0216649.1 tRNA 2'-phosphotransferase 1 [Mortierella sp. NVP41]
MSTPAPTNATPATPAAEAKKPSNNSRNRGPRGDSPTVRLSKALSWLLRHNAVSQGIVIRPDGYVKITDVLGHPKFKQFTLDDIIQVVDTNEKKRFEILENDNGEREYIRAVQGHSITAVSELGYEEITDIAEVPTAVHGTMFNKWHLINQKGLSKMNRNHIHMAHGMPGEDGVISGMRQRCDLYIHIDTAKALGDGIKFYRSSNNVILSDGKNGDGFIPPQYFSCVVRSTGDVIYPKPVS